MDEFYRQQLDLVLPCTSEDDDRITHNMTTATANTATCDDRGDFGSGGSLNDIVRFEDIHKMESSIAGSDMSDLIRTQISSHPLYPQLVSSYIQCQKVGAPPEIVSLLEEICRDHNHRRISMTCTQIGTNPELDEFMESYCEILHKYKEELSKPFDEATMFFNDIESQFNNLCKDANTSTTSLGSGNCPSVSDEVVGSSDEELSCGEAEASAGQDSLRGPPDDKNLKEVLLRKYSGYLSSLRKEFLKKRKNGKLPKDARMVLLDWWNSHYRWPYPTEEEKSKLSEVTGLDQKQINNWFINQRKRHWKPPEDMRYALMEGVGGSIGGPSYFDSGGAGHNF